ncbi:MAG: SDR family NAD(P)-dependent oxidoreductase, partial [Pseudomonadota bacterium]
MALAPGTLRDFVTVPAALASAVPARLSQREAAAVPANYLTAWHSLVDVAGLKAGESVLIHAAAGGTGLAAARVAQAVGARVFATASRGKWPALTVRGVQHVMDSRSAGFGKQVRALTDGRGVDVVLNSLTGDAIAEGLDALAPDGRFIEIGKREVWSSQAVAERRDDVHYHVVDLMDLARREPHAIGELFDKLGDALTQGKLPPPVLRARPLGEAQAALTEMTRSAHIGKRVLDVRPAPAVEPHATYLISGGFGGLGLATATWLVEQGATHLVLIGRRLPEHTPLAITRLRDRGTTVQALAADIGNADALANAFKSIGDMPRLRGIVHAAGVLDDALIAQTDAERLIRVLRP